MTDIGSRRAITQFRGAWDASVRYEVMREVLHAKFTLYVRA